MGKQKNFAKIISIFRNLRALQGERLVLECCQQWNCRFLQYEAPGRWLAYPQLQLVVANRYRSHLASAA